MKNKIAFLTILISTLFVLTSNAKEVEITLKHNLDGFLNGYCLDIKGGGRDIDPKNGLQVHTCYSYKGTLGKDQIFETNSFSKHILYMPKFNVCAQVSNYKIGTKVSLDSCSGSPFQSFTFKENGKISPLEANDICLTTSLDTKLGRNGTSKHQIKGLTLQKCSKEYDIFQTWTTNTIK